MVIEVYSDSKIRPFSFNYIVWIILTFGLILLTKFEETVQLVTKVVIPVLFLLTVIKKGGLKINNKGLSLYIIFTLWACLSLIYTVNSSMTMGYLQKLFGNVLIWFIVDYCVERINNIKYLLVPLLVIYLVHLYFGLFSSEAVTERNILRSTGLTDNPNSLGFLLWYGITIATLLGTISKRMHWKLIFYMCAVSFVFGIFDTASRKNLFAVIIFLGTYFFLLGKKRNYGLFLLILIAGYFLYETLYDFLLNSTNVGARLNSEHIEVGAESRTKLISQGWDFFISQPILGIGLGSFTTLSFNGAMSHNDYIEILASMGIVAFGIYAVIFYNFFKKVFKLVNLRNAQNWFIIPCGFLLGYLFLGLGRPAFLDPMAIFMFALYFGLINKAYKNYQIIEQTA